MIYDHTFYDSVSYRARIAAQTAASIVSEFLEPVNLIDVGSGQGVWSREFAEKFLTIREIQAIDLDSNNISLLDWGGDPNLKIVRISQNLETNSNLPDQFFDIGICVEVLEHVSSNTAEELILEFSKKCKYLIFSAALTGQGGTHHINEQSLKYWNDALSAVGFVPVDIFRNKFRSDNRIPSYYTNSIAFWINTTLNFHSECPPDWLKLLKLLPSELSDQRGISTKIRYSILGLFPPRMVTFIAKIRNR